jgi:hypothetical protein
MLDGYQPGDPVVAVFTYQANPAGRTAEQIADEAFDTFNDHPRDPGGADLACAYYGRRTRSLSFPGKRPCCPRSCCVHRGPRVVRVVVNSASWRFGCPPATEALRRKRGRDHLASQMETAARSHLRRLTIYNARLRHELEGSSGYPPRQAR